MSDPGSSLQATSCTVSRTSEAAAVAGFRGELRQFSSTLLQKREGIVGAGAGVSEAIADCTLEAHVYTGDSAFDGRRWRHQSMRCVSFLQQ